MAAAPMRSVAMPGGGRLPVLGLGTWRMGEQARRRAQEVDAVVQAIALGYRLIDTAEMYGEGGAESVIGAAFAQALRPGGVRREDLVLVSKVYPHNASRKGTAAACARSLQRLGVERLDLYLLHWRGQHPLRETCEAMRALVDDGRIARWGVSNFDGADLRELEQTLAELGMTEAPYSCAANQVYYSLTERGVELDLLARQRELGLPLMAYSPIDQGALAREERLCTLARARGASAAQVALAWILRQRGVVAIPKAARLEHLQENLAALQIELSASEVEQIERWFPLPRRRTPLAMR